MNLIWQVGNKVINCSTSTRPSWKLLSIPSLLPCKQRLFHFAAHWPHIRGKHQVSYLAGTPCHDPLHGSRPLLHHILGQHKPNLLGK